MEKLRLLAFIALIPQTLFAQPAANEKSMLERGKRAYERVCLECHGPAGRGDGEKARKQGFRPRDFTLGAFKCRCTASGQLPTDNDLLRTVTNGMPGTPMQAHEKDLSAEERAAVIQYVKTLSPHFAKETAPDCLSIPEPGPVTEEALFEGKQIYRILGCWKCHGKAGRGDGPSAAGLKDDWGQPIKPYNFTVFKRFKCGGDDRDFYRTLHTGMNGSPMPSFTSAFPFAREDVSEITFQGSYVLAEVQEIRDYLGGQPDKAAISAMSPAARRGLIDRRTWSLIHYLKSLLRR